MLNRDEVEQFRQVAYFSQFWRELKRDPIALVSIYLFSMLLVLVLLGRGLAPYAAESQFIGKELLPPFWHALGQFSHFLGTDDLGRDIFSRILYGFHYTAGAALAITFVIAFLGGLIGILAALKKGSSFTLLNHLFDTFLFTPILLIAIIIATLMEPSLVNAVLAVFLAMLPHFSHKIYQATQQELAKDYVIMLRLEGVTHWQLVVEVILPNLIIVALKDLSYIFSIAVLDISALSFIGLGAQSPMPEWGAMIRDSMELIYLSPWAVILSGVAIILVIFIVTLFGNSMVRVLEKYRY